MLYDARGGRGVGEGEDVIQISQYPCDGCIMVATGASWYVLADEYDRLQERVMRR